MAFAKLFRESRPVLYAGHSAGGLASILAASEDANARAVLGLDPVDNNGLGQTAAAKLTAPLGTLMGISSQCNSNQNGTTMGRAASEPYQFAVEDADHCDFESPTNIVCTAVCSNNSAARSDSEIQDVILTLSTAWISWHAGLEAEASRWWMVRMRSDDYIVSGAISEL